jgi:hypothetical protein
VIAFNDNWKDTQQTQIAATGLAPSADGESAIITSLAPGSYTVIVRGKNDTTGIALVEAYNLDPASGASLGNISTRGFVDTGDNVMIGGFIAGSDTGGTSTVLVRAIGPDLAAFNLSGVLQDPVLSLFDGNGSLIATNDNWKESQQADILATHLAPGDDRDSAILATLAPGNYTAIVRGQGGKTGIALVEVYRLP